MAPRLLNDIEAREAFHTLLLKRFAETLPRGTWRVKGGVNLRLFFSSIRYSEDMDLDADLRARDALKRETRNAIRDPHLRSQLVKLGIREVRQDGRAIHKDTDTTLRIKMQIIAQGGVPLPTKVEVSFRAGCSDDVAIEETADSQVAGRYLGPGELPLLVPHYTQPSAVRQKLAALALRTQVQARDVFDLFALTHGTLDGLDLPLLRRNLADATLKEARSRALEIPYEAYAGKVLEFLEEADRAKWAARWDEQGLFVAELAEALLAVPGGRAHPTADAVPGDTDEESPGGTG
jgi:predicted nucleotidyltransferase component of viral defense system